jgi:hypothetical protein
MFKITVQGLEDVRKRLQKFGDREVQTAMRNAINDTARDSKARGEMEVMKVFDRPTPLVQRPFFVRRATLENLQAQVAVKNVFGRFGAALENALEPHIPGYPRTREPKGMERALRNAGLLGPNEWLVPSRSMRLNQYGNVPGSTASKMLNDMDAFGSVAGFDSTTKAPKVRYVWGEVSGVKGIWLASKFRRQQGGALQMLVVKNRPTYSKRFRIVQVWERHAARVLPGHAQEAVRHAIRRARLRGDTR